MTDPTVNNKRNGRWGLVFFVLLFIVIFLLGLFKFNWQGGFTRTVVKIIPLPIARVDLNFITYKEFNENLIFLERYSEHLGERKYQNPNSLVLEKLIQEALIKKLAKKYDLIATKQEIKANSLSLLTGVDTLEELEGQLEETFGWSLKKYQKKIIKPYILQKKVAKKISTDSEINQDKLAEAQRVLELIKNEELSFGKAAQFYSQDQKTAPQGGDLGQKPLAEFSEKFILAIKDLEIGQISDIIKINGGYYIFKLQSKDETENLYEIRQIYFSTKTLAEYLTAFRKEVTVKIYGRI